MTQRKSPPTLRVMRILEVFAADPTTSLSLSTVARRLELSPATCLGILNELTSGGYLVRDPDTLTYRLGPALAALGHAATDARPVLGVIRDALGELAASTGLLCNATAATDDQIVIVDVAAPGNGNSSIRVGRRFPFRAPAGIIFAIWDCDSAVQAWLDRSLVELPSDMIDHAWSVIAGCRQSGYLARRLGQTERTLHEMLSHTLAGADREELTPLLGHALGVFTQSDYVHVETEQGETCQVSNLSAPAFNDQRRPEFVLSVHAMSWQMPTSELRRSIDLLLGACDKITTHLGGSSPASDPTTAARCWARTHGGVVA